MSRTEPADGERDALVARWMALTREVLPGMAAAQHWPIHLDHCFMRVCLDAVLGAPWTRAVARPAIHNMDDRQLAEAVRVAEGIAAAPDTLVALNQQSLAGRRRAADTGPAPAPGHAP